MRVPSMVTEPSSRSCTLRASAQLGGDVVHDDRVLLAIVLGVGEQERQQLVAAELGDRPEEASAPRACATTRRAGRWRRRARAARRRRRSGNGADGQADELVAVALRVVEHRVGVVEEEQVLALDVEDRAPWC